MVASQGFQFSPRSLGRYIYCICNPIWLIASFADGWIYFWITLPKSNIAIENRPSPKGNCFSNHPFSGSTVGGQNPADQLISSLPTIIYRVFIHPRWLLPFGNSSQNVSSREGTYRLQATPSEPEKPRIRWTLNCWVTEVLESPTPEQTKNTEKKTNKSQHLIIFNNHES